MKTAVGKFWKTYKKGVRWLMVDPQDELFIQLIANGMIITEVSLLWILGYEHAKAFTFMMVAYLLILYFFGWKKDCNEGSILQGSHAEEYYRNAYWLVSMLLIGVTSGYCRTCLIAFLALAPFVATILIMLLWASILAVITLVTKNRDFIYESKVIYVLVFYILVLLPVILSVSFLPIFWAWKVLIVGAYILLAPLMVVGSDNSMDFTQLISVMWWHKRAPAGYSNETSGCFPCYITSSNDCNLYPSASFTKVYL